MQSHNKFDINCTINQEEAHAILLYWLITLSTQQQRLRIERFPKKSKMAFEEIHNDVLLLILNYMSLQDIGRLAQANKALRRIVYQDALWVMRLKKEYLFSNEEMEKYLDLYYMKTAKQLYQYCKLTPLNHLNHYETNAVKRWQHIGLTENRLRGRNLISSRKERKMLYTKIFENKRNLSAALKDIIPSQIFNREDRMYLNKCDEFDVRYFNYKKFKFYSDKLRISLSINPDKDTEAFLFFKKLNPVHCSAVEYLMQAKNMSLSNAMEKVDGLSDSKASFIAKGATPWQAIRLGNLVRDEYHMDAYLIAFKFLINEMQMTEDEAFIELARSCIEKIYIYRWCKLRNIRISLKVLKDLDGYEDVLVHKFTWLIEKFDFSIVDAMKVLTIFRNEYSYCNYRDVFQAFEFLMNNKKSMEKALEEMKGLDRYKMKYISKGLSKEEILRFNPIVCDFIYWCRGKGIVMNDDSLEYFNQNTINKLELIIDNNYWYFSNSVIAIRTELFSIFERLFFVNKINFSEAIQIVVEIQKNKIDSLKQIDMKVDDKKNVLKLLHEFYQHLKAFHDELVKNKPMSIHEVKEWLALNEKKVVDDIAQEEPTLLSTTQLPVIYSRNNQATMFKQPCVEEDASAVFEDSSQSVRNGWSCILL